MIRILQKTAAFWAQPARVASLMRPLKGHVDAALNNAEDDHKGGVEPPQSKVLRTFSPRTPGLTAYITNGMERQGGRATGGALRSWTFASAKKVKSRSVSRWRSRLSFTSPRGN